MDLMRMGERQRAAWLMANRATVFAVGLSWLGLIVWELAHERSPVFLVVMVPCSAWRAAAPRPGDCARAPRNRRRPCGDGTAGFCTRLARSLSDPLDF
jgi:hypothetical protein